MPSLRLIALSVICMPAPLQSAPHAIVVSNSQPQVRLWARCAYSTHTLTHGSQQRHPPCRRSHEVMQTMAASVLRHHSHGAPGGVEAAGRATDPWVSHGLQVTQRHVHIASQPAAAGVVEGLHELGFLLSSSRGSQAEAN